MAQILPKRRKTLHNQSINRNQVVLYTLYIVFNFLAPSYLSLADCELQSIQSIENVEFVVDSDVTEKYIVAVCCEVVSDTR